jgi:nicotinate-nucleotide adenylyltransferase
MRSIGIYSGTFDPVHPGHVAFAIEARASHGLDEVVFLPERSPRAKPDASSLAHRIALLQAALQDQAGLHILELESDQFTVQQTLPELRQALGDTQLTMLLGSDVVRTFPYRWEGLEELLRSVDLAIGIRSGDDPAEITAILQELEHDYGKPLSYHFVVTADADLASTHIRNGTVDIGRLHPATVRYMQTHGLYARH